MISFHFVMVSTISSDAISVFKYGRTVPVKVRITDCAGKGVAGLAPVIGWSSQGSLSATDPINKAQSTSAADTGSVMRSESGGGIYIYNFATRPTLPEADATYFFYVREPHSSPGQVSQRFSIRR